MEGVILSAGVTFFSLGLLVISLVSYMRYKNVKLLFISCVFLVFFVKGLFLSVRLFFFDVSFVDVLFSGSLAGLFDLVILVLLFIATLRR